MITPELIRAYQKSEHVKDTVKSLEKEDDPSRRIHTKVRNYLMTTVAANNAARAGGIINLTVAQFKSAIFYPQYGNYMMEVCSLVRLTLLG